jgi:hypothetical protein
LDGTGHDLFQFVAGESSQVDVRPSRDQRVGAFQHVPWSIPGRDTSRVSRKRKITNLLSMAVIEEFVKVFGDVCRRRISDGGGEAIGRE